jgi:Leucine-rich repeat (LRR) protein
MTTAAGKVEINMEGSGAASIDWGDGTALETAELTAPASYFTHWYPEGAPARTIKAVGNITHLACSGNGLTALDVSKNTTLTYLSCYSNGLTALDISKNTALTRLECDNNELTALDVSKNTVLAYLDCYDNKLTALDASNNTALTNLLCQGNLLEAAGLNALFGTLHGNAGTKTVYIKGNPGAGACTQSIATGKGWTVNTTTD